MKLARRVCHAANMSDAGLTAGDTTLYGGAKTSGEEEGGKNLESKVQGLSASLTNLHRKLNQKQGGKGGDKTLGDKFGRRGDGVVVPRSLQEKLDFTCKAWNTEQGCDKESCPDKHQCNVVLKGGYVCWSRHRAVDHKER